MSREQYNLMQGQTRSHTWSLGVVGVLAAFIVGFLARRHVDGIPVAPPGAPVVVDGLLASRQKGIEISESDYFTKLAAVLEELYVDGVKDRLVLADGAVRGMVNSLADPHSIYYGRDQMTALTRRMEGQYEGLGLELELEYDQAELNKLQDKSRNIDALMLIPVLRVSAVIPGGPADRAGIREGDIVTAVNKRAVISSLDVKELRDLMQREAKDKALSAELSRRREEFRRMTVDNLPAGQARERLTLGTKGEITVTVKRGSERIQTVEKKALTVVPPVVKKPDGSYQIRFVRGLAEAFVKEGLNKKAAVLDLRRSGQGDFGSMKALLEKTAPPGPYGSLTTQREGLAKTLTVSSGSPSGPRYTLLVDKTTEAAAEVYALAMSSRGRASLSGTSMAGDPYWVDVYATAAGEGYTLTTGIYRPVTSGPAKSTVQAMAATAKRSQP